MDPNLLNNLVRLRHALHQRPELSDHEAGTSSALLHWLRKTHPDRLITSLGGHGLASVYDSGKEGPSVLFRCELDALPILETSSVAHRSTFDGIGHLCGHDGHMAIMAGLATLIGTNRPARGKAVILFQPAEETGNGAARVLTDPQFPEITPDYAFALHNLPGFPTGHIILADPVFSAGSIGMEIELTGKTSHAAEPENGINPAMAVSRIIAAFHDMPGLPGAFNDVVLITIIQVILGEKAFGTSAGHAMLRATLRALNEKDFTNLVNKARAKSLMIAQNEGLDVNIATTEEFPVTKNHPECMAVIQEIIDQGHWPTEVLEKPFRWSEDFGHFTKNFKGALIGLGAGADHPKLHHPDYDFPDEIIPRGMEILSSIYLKYLL